MVPSAISAAGVLGLLEGKHHQETCHLNFVSNAQISQNLKKLCCRIQSLANQQKAEINQKWSQTASKTMGAV